MLTEGLACSTGTFRKLGKSLGLILLYFFFSISLTFYNKKTITDYHFPLIFTLVHLAVKYLAASVLRATVECCKKEQRVVLPWSVYAKQVALTGAMAALDIGLSNWSLIYITVSLYTMTKSTALVFILVFGLIFKLETFKWLHLVVILSISVGLTLFVYKSTQFALEGFLMCLGAAFCSGVRWNLSQLLTQRKELGLHNPIDAMYHIQPWMLIIFTPLALTLEGTQFATSEGFLRFTDDQMLMWHVAIMLGGAVLAFFLEFSEFLLVSHTSSLTLSVSGVAKEICTLLLAEKVNHDKMTWVNGIGLAICFVGIMAHVVLKVMTTKGEHLDEPEPAVGAAASATMPLLSAVDDHGSLSEEEEEEEVV